MNSQIIALVEYIHHYEPSNLELHHSSHPLLIFQPSCHIHSPYKYPPPIIHLPTFTPKIHHQPFTPNHPTFTSTMYTQSFTFQHSLLNIHPLNIHHPTFTSTMHTQSFTSQYSPLKHFTTQHSPQPCTPNHSPPNIHPLNISPPNIHLNHAHPIIHLPIFTP